MFTTLFKRSLRALAVSALTVTSAALPLTASAVAPSFSDVVVFGDSLSDTGNWLVATGGAFPNTPYFPGRFSNGLVWIDHLAAGLGQSALPSLLGGTNFAWGGARTGTNPPPVAPSPIPAPPLNLLTQTSLWASSLGGGSADANALYVLVGGGNDMRDARSTFSTMDAVGNAGRQISAAAAIAQLQSSLGVLASRGAEHVLVSNLPDLQYTPEATFLELGLTGQPPVPGLIAASGDVSARFNALLPGLVAYGTSLGLTMHFLDMNGVAQAVRNDALNNGGAIYGITNATTPCAPFPGNIGISCDVSAFSDALHPSARAHEIIAAAAFQAIGVTPVPEPQTVAMLCAGLLLIGSVVRRRQTPRA